MIPRILAAFLLLLGIAHAQPISQLPAATAVAPDDSIPATQLGNCTQPTGCTRRITPAQILSNMTAAQVGGALGFTPYNAANPLHFVPLGTTAGTAIDYGLRNAANGVLGLDADGNVGTAVRLGTAATPINRGITRTPFTYGNYENAVGISVRTNCTTCRPAVLSGFENGAPNISQDPDLDSVAAFVSNDMVAPVIPPLVNPTYDATHIYPATPLTASQVAAIPAGTFVITNRPTLQSATTLTNPFSVAANSQIVTVVWPNHGLPVGAQVTFQPPSGNTITVGSRNLAATFQVASGVDANTFTVKLAFLSTSAANNVGGTVTASAVGIPWRGAVTAVAADGTSISMQDWSQAGNGSAGQVPQAGITANVNGATNIWAENIVTHISAPTGGEVTTVSDGAEYDINNNTGVTASTPLTQANGIELVAMGSSPASDGTICRGIWERCFVSRGAQDAGFVFNPLAQPSEGPPHLAGFLALQTSGNAFAVIPGDGVPYSWRVDSATGNTFVGPNGTELSDTNLTFSTGSLLSASQLKLGSNSTTNNLDFSFGATGTDFNMRLSNDLAGTMQIFGTRTSDGGHLPIMTWRGADTNSFVVQGAATGVAPLFRCGGDANCNTEITGNGTGGVLIGATQATTDPTTSTVPPVTCAPWYNTATPSYSIACNFNGGVQSIRLTSTGLPPGLSTTGGLLSGIGFSNGVVTSNGFNTAIQNDNSGQITIRGYRSSDSSNPVLLKMNGADVNSVLLTGGASGSPAVFSAVGDTNANLELKGSGTGGVLVGATQATTDPTTAAVPPTTCAPWYNTATHTYSIACNFNGAIQKAQLTSSGYPTAPQYTVATLPACGSANDGQFAEVTDQSGTPTYGGALTGGGTAHWPVFCDGTAWTAH